MFSLLCAIAAASLTSAFTIACASICRSNSVFDTPLVTVKLISLAVLSTALTISSIGASNIALDTLGLVCTTEPPDPKSVAPGVYVSITTF